ncbi:Orotidine 5'-phosphate decarboxylase [Candidatus Magnetomoraceae bacterium gMMP-1]
MKQIKNPIIFPLDVPDFEEAKKYISLLSKHVAMFKVGLELFISVGPLIIKYILDSGSKVFLDLKLHDIPITVNRAMQVISKLGVSFITVHCSENPEMLQAAVSGGKGMVKVLGITVLTSANTHNLCEAGIIKEFYSDISKLVMKRAQMAKHAGCAGIVCSGQEVKTIKEALGKDFLAVTPGIRPLWDMVNQDDQKRITTPEQAIKNGADYLVIGRPIRDADDPVKAVKRILSNGANLF